MLHDGNVKTLLNYDIFRTKVFLFHQNPLYLTYENNRTMTRQPTEAELEILHILWEEGAQTVRSVNEALNETRDVGYTSTLKTMQLMTEKGLLERDTSRRSHVYSPLVEEEDTRQNLLQSFIHKAFRGSATEMILQALGQEDASPEELQEIKELIRKKEEEKRAEDE